MRLSILLLGMKKEIQGTHFLEKTQGILMIVKKLKEMPLL